MLSKLPSSWLRTRSPKLLSWPTTPHTDARHQQPVNELVSSRQILQPCLVLSRYDVPPSPFHYPRPAQRLGHCLSALYLTNNGFNCYYFSSNKGTPWRAQELWISHGVTGRLARQHKVAYFFAILTNLNRKRNKHINSRLTI